MLIPMPMFRARSAIPSLVINGEDILLGLASQNIISFCYTDNTSDKADDLAIEIADPTRSWMMRYLPATKKGIECTASFMVNDWAGPFDNRILECGIFFINHIHFQGPPNTVSIKATSIPPNGVKSTKKYKSWENSDLKTIGGEIAEKNGLTLFYDTQDNPKVKRTDQIDKSDIEYLRDRCKEAKLSLKIHKKQLVIYSEEEYEARDPLFIIQYGNSNVLEWEFNSKSEDTFAKSKNSYVNPETGKVTETEFNPSTLPEGTTASLTLNEAIENEPDTSGSLSKDFNDWNDDPSTNKGKGAGGKSNSERKCKAKLREKNKKEHQCSLKVIGNIDMLSGLNIETWGFGIFDKKWFIESSQHDIGSSGYVTTLKCRGALQGY